MVAGGHQIFGEKGIVIRIRSQRNLTVLNASDFLSDAKPIGGIPGLRAVCQSCGGPRSLSASPPTSQGMTRPHSSWPRVAGGAPGIPAQRRRGRKP